MQMSLTKLNYMKVKNVKGPAGLKLMNPKSIADS